MRKEADVIALYFSAKWCNPCRMFTPVLTKFYQMVNAKSKQLEVIFVSSDQTEAEWKEYFAKMPWLAVGWNEKLPEMASEYQVPGIPMLLIIDKTGEVISFKGRELVMGGQHPDTII